MLGTWTQRLPELAEEFRTGTPFPLLVIDDFLVEDEATALLAEFPAIDAMPRSHDYVFGDKRETATFASAGPASRRYHDLLLSPEFARIVSEITGRTLFIDDSFHGGGFHQGGDGSYLDTHVDFNLHPAHNEWLRVLNVLLYLNRDWQPSYGGDLLIRRDPKDEPRAIAPLFNRGVIMLTSDFTYHGYRRMSLPPGVTRKSIAAYAYEQVPAGSLQTRTTSWSPEGAGLVKRTLARHWDDLASVRRRLRGARSGGDS
jgi:hypothetical protein